MHLHDKRETTMNIEDFRSYCLSLKGATEKMPFVKAASDYGRSLIPVIHMLKRLCENHETNPPSFRP